MNIEEFNTLNEKLINQLNEEADPLTPASDPNDIKDSLKIKADKKNAEKQEAYIKAKMTDPKSRIGELARLTHSVKVKDAADAENDKRKLAISQKLGEQKKGILEGLEDITNDIDTDIITESDDFEVNFHPEQTSVNGEKDLQEGLKNIINNIKEKIAKKKARKHSEDHSKLIGQLDDLKSQIKEKTHEYNKAKTKADETGKEKHAEKAIKILGEINELEAKVKTAEADYDRVDQLVADDEFKGLRESLSMEKLFEEAEKLSKEVRELVSDIEKKKSKEKQTDDFEIPEIQPTGDPDIDDMVNNIVNEINNEKQKQKPDTNKIKKLLLKIKQLTK